MLNYSQDYKIIQNSYQLYYEHIGKSRLDYINYNQECSEDK